MKFDFRLTHPNRIALLILAAGAIAFLAGGNRGQLRFTVATPVDTVKITAASERLDPNIATIASLRRLPGIGVTRARRIVHYRQNHGPSAFAVVADLRKVPGIGPGIARTVAPYLTLPNSLPK
ncbi:MAG: helix-hairpin-helix domain-containing protein [Phycisphaerae bacterium]|nr:helix-hairpin-helix domain-containing protein [Phycisphaerae bacterium]